VGVQGFAGVADPDPPFVSGVHGVGVALGVLGQSAGTGVLGESPGGANGVAGSSNASGGVGVRGDGSLAGLQGFSENGTGVHGLSDTGTAVAGDAAGAAVGVRASNFPPESPCR
jgi:hypothetical protein